MAMKLLSVLLVAVAAASIRAAEFPYGVDETSDMTIRHVIDSAQIGPSAPVDVPAVNGGMPEADSVAVLYAAAEEFLAYDEDQWDEGVSALGDVQAALAIKKVNDILTWMGYSAGQWVALAADGAAAQEGSWRVRFEIDYTTGAGAEKIRYLVRRSGADEFIPLAPISGGSPWLTIGNPDPLNERVVDIVRLYGCGETAGVNVKSGRRLPSGEVSVTESMSADCRKTHLKVLVDDLYGYDSVKVSLADAEGGHQVVQAALSSEGLAEVDLSPVVERGESYSYQVTLVGNCRGEDISKTETTTHDLYIGRIREWFSFENGEFVLADKDMNLSIDNGLLKAAAVSPRGRILPDKAAPRGTQIVEIKAEMKVSGARQESTLGQLDVTATQGALAMVRYSDGVRCWSCRKSDGSGWIRLTGAPTANGDYSVKILVDYRDGHRSIGYMVGASGVDTLVQLQDENGNVWFDLPENSSIMTKASILGASVSRIGAACKIVPQDCGLTLWVY